MQTPNTSSQFSCELMKFKGKGGWIYVEVPPNIAPTEKLPFGKCPVTATVDGNTWDTSLWQEKSGRCVLIIPKKHRVTKDKGASVTVSLDMPHLEIDPDNYRKYI